MYLTLSHFTSTFFSQDSSSTEVTMRFLVSVSLLCIAHLGLSVSALPSSLHQYDSTPLTPANVTKEKRGLCSLGCPYGQYRGGGCLCTPIPGVIVGCQLLCVAKPAVEANAWLSAFGGKPKPAVTCDDQTKKGYPLRARQHYNSGLTILNDRSWDIQQFWDSNDEASSNIHYTGGISSDGDLHMYVTEEISANRNYVVGITVTGWTYYYTLEGYTQCHTKNEDLIGTISNIDVLEAPH